MSPVRRDHIHPRPGELCGEFVARVYRQVHEDRRDDLVSRAEARARGGAAIEDRLLAVAEALALEERYDLATVLFDAHLHIRRTRPVDEFYSALANVALSLIPRRFRTPRSEPDRETKKKAEQPGTLAA